MKVYPLHVGDETIAYGQFYLSPKDWTIVRGFWRTVVDRNHAIVVPDYAYLIDHPQAGLILVDTGLNWEQAHEPKAYYKESLMYRLLMDEDMNRLTREQELPAQVQRVGYRCEDIQMVILTHLHYDHLGGLRSVPQAKVIVSRDEWNGRTGKTFGFIPNTYLPSIASITAPELVSYSSGPFHNFERSQDLLLDGSIILLPTPGHTSGSLSVFLHMGDYHLLLVGDTLYTLRHLAVDQLRAVTFSRTLRAQQISSIRRIQQLRQALPSLVIAPEHDHTDYIRKLLGPFLADGGLSLEEQQAIKTYETSLFDEGGHLVPSALPHFLPPLDRGRVGSVTEPALGGARSSDRAVS